MRRGQDRIDEEHVSIDALVHYLNGMEGESAIEVRAEPDDPPDYWLSVRGQRFAVEITCIVDDAGYDANRVSLLKSVQEAIRTQREILGSYEIRIFRRPDLPKTGSKAGRKLVEDIVIAIKNLNQSPDSKVELIHESSGTLGMTRFPDNDCKVGMTFTPEPKSGREVQQEVAQLLEQAITTKRSKIQKKGIIEACPDVILLLYNAYPYGGVDHAKLALAEIKGFDWLHSIFWAAPFTDRPNVLYPESPGRSGVFLHTKNGRWA